MLTEITKEELVEFAMNALGMSVDTAEKSINNEEIRELILNRYLREKKSSEISDREMAVWGN